MKIVFYIRSIFGDSELKLCDSVNAARACKNFNLFSKLTLIEYRKRVHAIQLSCLKDISPHIIHNIKETNRHTFDCIQPSALNQLLCLDDDDIVIPLDDDDWVSPEIKNVNFSNYHATIWNTVRITNEGIFHFKKNIQLPYRELQENEAEYLEAKRLLSNCVAFRVDFLKKLASRKPTEPEYFIKNPPDLRQCLQLHTRPRLIIRDKKYLNCFAENILDKCLSIYVRHAGNITGPLSELDADDITQTKFNSVISSHKIPIIVPEQFFWAKNYFADLNKLNNLL